VLEYSASLKRILLFLRGIVIVGRVKSCHLTAGGFADIFFAVLFGDHQHVRGEDIGFIGKNKRQNIADTHKLFSNPQLKSS